MNQVVSGFHSGVSMDISVDVGSGLTKWQTADSGGCFPSAVGETAHLVESDFQVQSYADDTVTISLRRSEHAYIVGAAADRLLRQEHRADTLTPDWATKREYRALLYRALSEGLPPNYNGPIRLCVGLPQAFYEKLKPRLVSDLTGTHKFSVGDAHYQVTVKEDSLFVIPQAMGVFFYHTAQDPDSALHDVVCVIDVGTFTTGYSLINHGMFDRAKSGGIEVGIASLSKQVRSYISSQFGHRLDLPVATRATIQGKVRIQGKSHSLRSAIPTLAGTLADEITDVLQDRWGNDSATALILVAGGGAEYILPALKKRWPHVKMAAEDKEASMVIVRGYAHYLAAQA